MHQRMIRLVTCAVALAGTLGVAALTQPAVAAAASHGFRIYNFSSNTLVLTRATALKREEPTRRVRTAKDNECWEGRPIDGAVQQPGSPAQDWKLKYKFLNHYFATLQYKVINGGGGPDGTLTVYLDTFSREIDSRCTITIGTCKAGGLTITILDPPGTTHNIPPDRAAEQFQTLKDLCNQSNSATVTCSFNPTRRQPAPGDPPLRAPARIVGHATANCFDTPQISKRLYEDTFGQENSVELAVGSHFEIDYAVGKAGGSIEWNYGHKWTTEHKFSEEEELDIDPGHLGWVTDEAPIIRDTGDYTLQLGNTTWILRGVYFDSPDPNGSGIFAKDTRKLTPSEYAAECPHKASKRLVTVPTSLVFLEQTGSNGRNLLIGGPTSDTIRGLAGNDIIRGGGGNDTLLRRPRQRHPERRAGARHARRRPGRGHDRRHSRADARADGDRHRTRGWDRVYVRDGRGDDTVICGSRQTIVTVDPGDRVIGRCGKVIRLRRA